MLQTGLFREHLTERRNQALISVHSVEVDVVRLAFPVDQFASPVLSFMAMDDLQHGAGFLLDRRVTVEE